MLRDFVDRALRAAEIQHAQLWREPRGLLDPVEQHRARDHDERRPAELARRAETIEPGEHHDGLAEPHVVGETAAEAEAPEKGQPAERVALIVAQLPLERR